MNYFNLILDTTSPYIQITYEKSSMSDTMLAVIIESDDALDDGQELIFRDSAGVEHTYPLQLNDSKANARCLIELELLPSGVATSIVRLQDEVWNQSNIVSTQFDVDLFRGKNSYLQVMKITQGMLTAVLRTQEVINVKIDAEQDIDSLLQTMIAARGLLDDKMNITMIKEL